MQFANLLLLGKTATDAYQEVYSPKGNPKVTKVRGHEVKHRPAVQAYIAAEQAKNQELVGATRAQKRRLLLQAMMDTKATWRERLSAIQLDNLMTGDNKPMRIEGELTLIRVLRALEPTTGLFRPEELQELEALEVLESSPEPQQLPA